MHSLIFCHILVQLAWPCPPQLLESPAATDTHQPRAAASLSKPPIQAGPGHGMQQRFVLMLHSYNIMFIYLQCGWWWWLGRWAFAQPSTHMDLLPCAARMTVGKVQACVMYARKHPSSGPWGRSLCAVSATPQLRNRERIKSLAFSEPTRRLADEPLDGTLTFQQKYIALTFDVPIDPMSWVTISPETNIYNWYWVPVVLSQCLWDAMRQYKSIHTYRHNVGTLVLTGHLRRAGREDKTSINLD